MDVIMKKYIYIILGMLMALSAHAASYTTVTIDNIGYRLYAETMEAHVYHDKSSTSLTVTDNRLVLPEKVTNDDKEYTVTEIEYFRCGNTNLTLVTPNSMKTVASVKSGVKTLVLSAGVTSVSDLSRSEHLEAFEIAEGNESFSVDDNGVLYSKDKTKLWFAPYGKRSSFGSYTVASTATYIGPYAFYYFSNLETVSLPEGLKEIAEDAFNDCSKLVNCKLPSTVETIGANAFRNCAILGLTLPEQLRTIGNYAFRSGVQGDALTSLAIPQYVESIGDYAFQSVTVSMVYAHCKPFVLTTKQPFGSPTNQTLIVPKGTRDIFSTRQGWKLINKVIEGDFEPTFNVEDYPPGSSALDSDGQEVTQDGVTYKFYNSGVARVYCSNYTPASGQTELTIPESLYFRAKNYTVDGVEQFNASTVIDLLLPNTITFVNSVKGGVKILKLPKSVTSVSDLSESMNLEAFEIADGNESFSLDDNGVLYSKDKTKLWFAPYGKRSSFGSYTVASTVTYIGPSAFYGFNQLARLNLPEGLEEIAGYAFYNCTQLTECNLPSTVRTIGAYAFYNCAISGLTLPEQLRTIGNYAFRSGVQGDALTSLTIPQYVESIGNYAFGSVTIGTIYSWIMQPLPISTSAFKNQSSIKLVVPTGTKETYQIMDGWKLMTDITESDDLLPSSVKCDKPTFAVSGNTMTMTTKPADASIYYTLDGRQPTVNSTLYTGPITLTSNCTVKAFAVKTGIQDSDVATYTVDWFKVEQPTFKLDGSKLTIETATEGASIYYTLGAELTPSATRGTLYTAPIELTDNRVVKAIAVKEGFADSDIAEFTHGSVSCPTPVFEKYDGRYITFKPISGAEIYYTTDGTTPTKSSTLYDGRAAISGLCTVKAKAFSDIMNPSEVATFEITYFYNGEQAQLTEAGTLEKAFEWCGTQGMTELSITGPLNSVDLTFIKTKLGTLQYLDMEQATIADHALPAEAFAGMDLISFTSSKDINSVGERVFADCQYLAAVVWNASEKLPVSSFGDNVNPNLLLYVNSAIFAPSGIRNVISNGLASQIVISDADGNNNFYCPVAFKTEKISYTHNYSMQTQVGKCMGWETIVLPFTVQKVMHESKGELISYKRFEDEGNSEETRPFWLRALTDTGFEDVATIEANTPYIISMPNSSEYAARYNVAGNVTFSAEQTEVPATKSNVVNKGNVSFVPALSSVAKSNDAWAINRNVVYDNEPEGSVFVPNLREVRPFEAYVTTKVVSNMPPFLSIVSMGGNDGTTGIEWMLNNDMTDAKGSWYTIDGRKLQEKPTQKGIYIVNGKKVVIQ